MKKRKPNAADRDLTDYVRNLPVGKHLVIVEQEKGQAVIKFEGGRIMFLDPNRITIVPNGTRPVRVTATPFDMSDA